MLQEQIEVPSSCRKRGVANAILDNQAQVELDGTVTPDVVKEEVEVEMEPVKIVELLEVVKSTS